MLEITSCLTTDTCTAFFSFFFKWVMVENTRMFLMSKFRCVTLFLHISTSQLFALACYEISFSPITVFFFLLSPSLRQHTVYRCHYSSEEKGRVHLCDSMKQVTSIQGRDECFPITAHHSPSQHSEASLQPVHLSTSPLAGFFFSILHHSQW